MRVAWAVPINRYSRAFSASDVATARVCTCQRNELVHWLAPDERVEHLVARRAPGATLTFAWRGHSELSKTNSECYAMYNAASLPCGQ